MPVLHINLIAPTIKCITRVTFIREIRDTIINVLKITRINPSFLIWVDAHIRLSMSNVIS